MDWASESSSRKRGRIGELIAEGRSYREICAEMGLCKSTVAYHARRLGLPADERCARRYDWEEVQRAIDSGAGRLECIERFGISPWSWNESVKRGRIRPNDHRIPLDDLLVAGRGSSRSNLKQRLFAAGLKEARCETCGIDSWEGRPLSLALHHVNGVGDDNRLENLQILCPNCHSQTSNFGARNKRSGSRTGAAE